MKLSNLYTKGPLLETNALRKLIGYASKAFGQAKRSPNVKHLRTQQALNEVFPEVWAEYHGNPKAQRRLEAYKSGSFQQHLKELSTISNVNQLKEEIRKILKKRAERILYQQQDPKAKYRSLGLDPEQAEGLTQREEF
jgi:hypothetical protein